MYWKKGPKKRGRGGAKRLGIFAAVCALLLVTGSGVRGVDKLSDLQTRFDKDTHGGSKVKELEKVTDAQFEEARKASAASDFVAVGLLLEKFRDNVRDCLALLKKQEPDADKHPAGYRRLELQVRRGIREVEETLIIAPPEMHPPLEIVHKDILDMDDELIRLLFPRRTPDPVNVPPVPEAKP
jgi:hypothetical protein